jgi:hypothetical protein
MSLQLIRNGLLASEVRLLSGLKKAI